jgi:hypothetical protein
MNFGNSVSQTIRKKKALSNNWNFKNLISEQIYKGYRQSQQKLNLAPKQQ